MCSVDSPDVDTPGAVQLAPQLKANPLRLGTEALSQLRGRGTGTQDLRTKLSPVRKARLVSQKLTALNI